MSTVSEQDSGSVTCRIFRVDEINESGAYACNWSGHLLRVPEESIQSGSPLIHLVGTEPLYVTKLSDDPYVSLSKARLVASNNDVRISF